MLNEGLKCIDDSAFSSCKSLKCIIMPEGLERIGEQAFQNCKALIRIIIPSTVKEYGGWAFAGCDQLINVELNKGLERIGDQAFHHCSSLERIRIPSTVKAIGSFAFQDCENLVTIKFCEEMEKFVNEASLNWWNCALRLHSSLFEGTSPLGACEAILWQNSKIDTRMRTYSFLVRCNIPSRLDTIKMRIWRKNIHNMLQRIPEAIAASVTIEDDEQEEEFYFKPIESQLANYEHLQYGFTVLELALWKAKIVLEQLNGNIGNVKNDVKLMCRVNSVSMFAIIFPNVISFLYVDE